MVYGHYHVETLRTVFRCLLPKLVLPVSCAGNGMADAIYAYQARCPEKDLEGHHLYRLVGIQEWLPPIHPSLQGRPDRATCTRPDGGADLEAEAVKRRREWKNAEMLDGAPVWDEDDE